MCNSFIIIIINYPVRRCYLKYNVNIMLNSDFFFSYWDFSGGDTVEFREVEGEITLLY